jgi:aryl-alcohol dehydrogenase-like predicted oxidoreductase
VGTSSPEHLRSNLAIAAKGPLPDEVYAEVKKALG